MIQLLNSNFLSPTTELRSLILLQAINGEPENSQHKLGKMTGLSSSMVNNYMKRFKEDGLISIKGETNRSRTYHLTKVGRNLLRESLLSCSAEIVQLYGAVKREIAKILNEYYDRDGLRTVVLYGAADTAEVVHTALKETPLVVIGIVDSDINKQGKSFNGFIIQAPEQIRYIRPDAVIITSFAKQEEIYQSVCRIVSPGILIKKLSVI